MRLQIIFCICLFTMKVFGEAEEYPNVTLCQGASSPRERNANPLSWIRFKYKGCTHVTGHLIVADTKFGDLSFLNSIVEVYGTVVIKNNDVDVPLKNLKVIRGYKHKGRYSLTVFRNNKHVDLRSLRSVVVGGVFIKKNAQKCYFPTINWTFLFEDRHNRPVVKPSSLCSNACHADCRGHCWGAGPDMCQKFAKCRGKSVDLCKCDEQCIGGCTGETSRDCVACRNFLNVDECVKECPERYINNPSDNERRKNPKFKYGSGYFCRKACPKHLFIQGDICLATCDEHHFVKGQRCEPCPENKCSKDHCRLDDLKSNLPIEIRKAYKRSSMHRSLIKSLVACKSLFGDITINSVSGNVNKQKIPDEHVRFKDLDNLKNLRYVHGTIHIDLISFPQVTNLSFLSSLESVTNHEFHAGFEIYRGANLIFLGLKRLRKLVVNQLSIVNNPHLCFLGKLRQHFDPPLPEDAMRLTNNSSTEKCSRKKLVCDPNCSKLRGCWGPGPSMCVACAAFVAGQRCVRKCEDERGFYTAPAGNATCLQCHPECAKTCSGPNPDQCKGGCQHFKDKEKCVMVCPPMKYPNATSRICLPCASSCTEIFNQRTCSGPLAVAGPNGCNRCSRIVAVGTPHCYVKSPNGFYKTEVDRENLLKDYPSLAKYVDPKNPTILLHPCNSKCLSCSGEGPNKCIECQKTHLKLEPSTCVNQCPEGTYREQIANDSSKEGRRCLHCDPECLECTGSSNFNCTKCKTMKIFLDSKNQYFFCNSTCPAEMRHVYVNDKGDTYCSNQPKIAASTRLATSVATPSVLIVAFVMSVVASLYVWRRRARNRLVSENLHAKYTGRLADDQIRLNVTDAQPNACQLRLIGVGHIKKSNVIGAGAFGTVYKGIWTPEPDDPSEISIKVHVAIKELKNQGSKRSTEEFLSEARLMASVDNQYCIKLLGVCMASELMLISEFMPLGNLKDYLYAKKEEVGSKRLLLWATQIAKGMDYLTTRDILHRDLAARNVLLETEDLVRITDFGLAKLVDNGREFHDQGQRLPIKWLACECIRSQMFSTKSDVWAYGVTLWEMFMFGESPYKDIRVGNLLQHLDSGERLPQPPICTLDLYMVMIKCWLADPISRPTFEELLHELKKMASDPGRYLIIEGDEFRRGPLRSVSTITSSSLEGALSSVKGATAAVAVAATAAAVVDFDFTAAAKAMDTSTDSADTFENSHYVADPTSVSPEPRQVLLRRPPAITESFEEADDVFDENDYEQPLNLRTSHQTSEYVAPSPQRAEDSPAGYMNIPDSTPLLLNNPIYCEPHPNQYRPQFDESIEDYPLTPHPRATQYVNVRL